MVPQWTFSPLCLLHLVKVREATKTSTFRQKFDMILTANLIRSVPYLVLLLTTSTFGGAQPSRSATSIFHSFRRLVKVDVVIAGVPSVHPAKPRHSVLPAHRCLLLPSIGAETLSSHLAVYNTQRQQSRQITACRITALIICLQ